MILSEQNAKDTIKHPASKKEIESVKIQESQFRVFTEDLSKDELNGEKYWNILMSQMKDRADKKFDRVIQFARYPLPVVQLSDSILNDYFRVFDGKNRYFNASGDRDIQILNDWVTKTNPEKWIENHAREVFKNKPNSFVVVDRNDKGEPYLIYIGSDRLVDARFKDSEGNLEYISFIHSQEIIKEEPKVIKTFFSVYDDSKYYVFSKMSSQDDLILESSHEHGIGYCPGRSFVSSSSNTKNQFKRRIAFTSALSKMEDWTMFDIYRNYVDHYAPFPVTEAPRKKCGNDECQNGVVENVIQDPSVEGGERTEKIKCHICDGGANLGQHIMPGTHIGIKVQSDKTLEDGSGKFRMIFPETDKMKYVPEKLNGLELDIRYKTTGINTLSNEAVNELQVKGSFATMESVLLRTKEDLDILYVWIVKTVGNLIYKNSSIDVDANFGTEFYLISEEELQERFDNAKKIGLPVEEQTNIYKQIISTKYKGNTEKLERDLMLLDLDPFAMYSVSECVNLKKESVLDDFQLSLKVNFSKFISKFESENTVITEFGINLEYWKRVEAIEKSLYLYNEELINEKNIRNNPTSTNDDGKQPQVTQEQLEAQARLRGSVGGVQGILGIQASVSQGITSLESAIETMIEIYGFNRETAMKVLGDGSSKPNPDPNPDPNKFEQN